MLYIPLASVNECHINKLSEFICMNNESRSSVLDYCPTFSANALTEAIDQKFTKEHFSQSINLIGKGFFAKVYKVECISLNIPMAFKVPKSTEKLSKFMKEVILLKELSHTSILKFYGTCVIDGSFGCLTEFLNSGDLSSFIQSKKHTMKWGLIVRFSEQISSGLAYLHRNNIIHRDLSSQNILLDNHNAADEENIRAVIADLGLFLKLKSECNGYICCVGNPFYAAPEHLTGKEPYRCSSDMFAFGLVLCELITGNKNEHPDIPRTDNFGVDYAILPVRHDCPKWLQNLACDCCKVTIHQRPSAIEANSIIKQNGQYISLWDKSKRGIPNSLSLNSKCSYNNLINGTDTKHSVITGRTTRAKSIAFNSLTSHAKEPQKVRQPWSPPSLISSTCASCTSSVYSRRTQNSVLHDNNKQQQKFCNHYSFLSSSVKHRHHNSLDSFLEPTNLNIVKAFEDPEYSNQPLSHQNAKLLRSRSQSEIHRSDVDINFGPYL